MRTPRRIRSMPPPPLELQSRHDHKAKRCGKGSGGAPHAWAASNEPWNSTSGCEQAPSKPEGKSRRKTGGRRPAPPRVQDLPGLHHQRHETYVLVPQHHLIFPIGFSELRHSSTARQPMQSDPDFSSRFVSGSIYRPSTNMQPCHSSCSFFWKPIFTSPPVPIEVPDAAPHCAIFSTTLQLCLLVLCPILVEPFEVVPRLSSSFSSRSNRFFSRNLHFFTQPRDTERPTRPHPSTTHECKSPTHSLVCSPVCLAVSTIPYTALFCAFSTWSPTCLWISLNMSILFCNDSNIYHTPHYSAPPVQASPPATTHSYASRARLIHRQRP